MACWRLAVTTVEMVWNGFRGWRYTGRSEFERDGSEGEVQGSVRRRREKKQCIYSDHVSHSGRVSQVGIWKIARTIEGEGQVLIPAPPNVDAYRGCFGYLLMSRRHNACHPGAETGERGPGTGNL